MVLPCVVDFYPSSGLPRTKDSNYMGGRRDSKTVVGKSYYAVSNELAMLSSALVGSQPGGYALDQISTLIC